ncbi:hypothetical protein MKW98_014929 [Papaver atlanticum]|uniref:Chalcone isomerase domain-containing protein n=1 Tax=Papaver atlanticum TaxID=357466 RepID=A0AAD4SQ09_9MAGN|nr:hypothetical protein MKW98_014929 [Papaver atlanticum]
MRNNGFLFMDFDGVSPYVLPAKPIVFGSLAVQEAFNHISKFAGAVIFLCASGSNLISHDEVSGNPHCRLSQPTTRYNVAGMKFYLRSKAESDSPVLLTTLMNSTMKHVLGEIDHLTRTSSPVLSLAAALVPPFDNLFRMEIAMPENAKVQINGVMDQRPCLVENRESANLSFQEMARATNIALEPKTGIKFPTSLHDFSTDGQNSSCPSEVLVGTGYRSMRIVMFKSIKVYAFGLYVHTDSLCEKLGPKYANVPIDELSDRQDFLQDLVREDIHMSVRLVVNCRGMRINAVRDALEKPLRARLLKGTTIDVRRTMDGQLITRIGGKYIGAVPSKDLCMAFFDMYIGDAPVSKQARGEICKNVGSILRKCS